MNRGQGANRFTDDGRDSVSDDAIRTQWRRQAAVIVVVVACTSTAPDMGSGTDDNQQQPGLAGINYSVSVETPDKREGSVSCSHGQ